MIRLDSYRWNGEVYDSVEHAEYKLYGYGCTIPPDGLKEGRDYEVVKEEEDEGD